MSSCGISPRSNISIAQAIELPAEMVSMPISLQMKLALQTASKSDTPQLDPNMPMVSYSGPSPTPSNSGVSDP